MVETKADVTVVHGEDELFALTGPLFSAATEVSCAANDANTWAASRHRASLRRPPGPHTARKLYRPAALFDGVLREHIHELRRRGADVRVTPDALNETIILDGRVAILAGDRSSGVRSYGVVARPEVVRSVATLFLATWRRATDVELFDQRFAEARALAPHILEMLSSGCKDEAAARALGIGLRTYRRRVAELMAALGASSRFQAGVRARELGLV
ncbi:DNA-binding response regulator [Pseudonocardia sp. CA-107938]|uniref:helix-turn-helix transcriptional regulator n=1 Tax=Pseudonocardia sp. CA-107938 TaxID=3240021 RepID=UPI003D92B6ED